MKKGNKLGDRVSALAGVVVNKMKATDFSKKMASNSITSEEYLRYIAAMYPVVVEFTGTIRNSMMHLHHVRNAQLMRILADQLDEELEHNMAWRKMLDEWNVDHKKIYKAFERKSKDIPSPVMKMADLMRKISTTKPTFSNIANLYAIESVILPVVTKVILPAVKKNSKLKRGPASVYWWKEHSAVTNTGKKSAEMKHLENGQKFLNNFKVDVKGKKRILQDVAKVLNYFYETMAWHDKNIFPVKKYLSKK